MGTQKHLNKEGSLRCICFSKCLNSYVQIYMIIFKNRSANPDMPTEKDLYFLVRSAGSSNAFKHQRYGSSFISSNAVLNLLNICSRLTHCHDYIFLNPSIFTFLPHFTSFKCSPCQLLRDCAVDALDLQDFGSNSAGYLAAELSPFFCASSFF